MKHHPRLRSLCAAITAIQSVFVGVPGISAATAQMPLKEPRFEFPVASGTFNTTLVSAAGDVNRDGFDDVLVGQRFDSRGASRGGSEQVWSAGRDGALIHSILASQFALPAYIWWREFGSQVSGVGDVNGDGCDDFMAAVRVLVSQPKATWRGRVVVFSGREGGVLHQLTPNYPRSEEGNLLVFSGATGALIRAIDGVAPERLGDAVRDAGDVDGDGRHDSLVFRHFGTGVLYSEMSGAVLLNVGGWEGREVNDIDGDGRGDFIIHSDSGSAGRADVYSGATLQPIYSILGRSGSADGLGYLARGAGDINGDGFADVIVGAHGHGNATVMARVISGADGNTLHRFYGVTSGARFGYAVSGIGDVDRDGHDDLLVGAYGDSTAAANAGAVTLFSGGDGTVLSTTHGAAADDYYGLDVSSAGDVDRDGFPDFIVGAYGHDTPSLGNAGLARVISGKDGTTQFEATGHIANEGFGYSVSGAGNVDHDGYVDVIVGTFAASALVARVYSGRTHQELYSFANTSGSPLSDGAAGDVNGDGYDDVIVGATYSFGTSTGVVRVHSGFDGGVLIHDLVDAFNSGDAFGIALGTAGDTDGSDEVIVGAHLADHSATDVGSAFVYEFQQSRSTVLRPGIRRNCGAGCPGGSQRQPRIGALDRPAVGGPFAVALHGGLLAAASALLFIGTEASIPLAAIGMPDCTLLVSSFVQEFATADVLGMATHSIAIPNDLALLGVSLGMQWIFVVAAAPRGMPLSLSDGLRVVLGR